MKQMFLSNYDMDYSTLVICADLDKNVILDFVNWVSLPPEQKYEISVKVMFLCYMLKFSNYSKCA